MALTLRNSFPTSGNGASPQTVVKPAGAVTNDLLLLQVGLLLDVVPTPPPGFQLIPGAILVGDSQTIRIYQKLASASEPADYTVSWPGAAVGSLAMVAIGAGTLYAEPYLVATATTNSASANKIFAAVNNTVTSTLLFCFGFFSNAASTPDAAMAERWDVAGSGCRLYLMTQAVAATGATGTRTATGSSVTFQRMVTISVRENGSAPPALPVELDVTQVGVLAEMEASGVEVTEIGVFAEIGATGVYTSELATLVEIGAVGVYVTAMGVYAELLYVPPEESMPVTVTAAAGTRRMHTKLPEEITGYAFDPIYSWWSSIVAEESTNLIINPSFEGWDDSQSCPEYLGGGSGGLIEYVEFPAVGATAGRRCVRMTTQADYAFIYYHEPMPVTPGPYTFSLDAYVTRCPFTLQLEIVERGSFVTVASRIFNVASTGWQRLSLTFVELGVADLELRLVMPQGNAVGVRVYTDAWQFEAKKYATTYLDGDMIGFADVQPQQSYYWHGAPHRSKSTRRARSGSGGRVVSWSQEARFKTTNIIGLGMSDVEQKTQVLGDGREVHLGMLDKGRDFTITGRIFGVNHKDLLNRRNDLVRLLKPNNTVGRDQMILRYQEVDDNQQLVGAPLDIICVYRDGMQGNTTNFYQENLPLQFHCVSPFPMDVIESSAELQLVKIVSNDGLIYLDEEGEYTLLGHDLTMGGVVSQVGFMRDGKIVAIGNYTTIGGDTVTGAAYWDGENWQALGLGAPTDANDIDDGFAIGYPLTVAGQGGDVYEYDDTTNLWQNLGSHGFLGPINTLQRDINGDIWVGGEFEFADDGTTPYHNIAKYNAATEDWETIGGGVTDPNDFFPDPLAVYTVLATNDGNVYFGGSFGQADYEFYPIPPTVLAKGVARWEIATQTWHRVAEGLGGTVRHLLRGPDGYIYAVGDFETDASLSPYPLRGFARYNGHVWEEVFELVNIDGVHGADGVVVDDDGIFWFWNFVADPDTDLFVIEGLGEVGSFGWRDGIFYPPYIPKSGFRDIAIGPGGKKMHSAKSFSGDDTQALPALNRIHYYGTAETPVAIHIHGPGVFSHLLNLSTEGGVYGKDGFDFSANEELVLRTDSQRALIFSNQRANLVTHISVGASNLKALRLWPGENRISILITDLDDEVSLGWLAWKNRFMSLAEALIQ